MTGDQVPKEPQPKRRLVKRRHRAHPSVEVMRADAFKEARQELGLGQDELGAMLGLSGSPKRSVRRYEQGESQIPGPIIRLIRAFLDGYRPKDWPKRNRPLGPLPKDDEFLRPSKSSEQGPKAKRPQKPRKS